MSCLESSLQAVEQGQVIDIARHLSSSQRGKLLEELKNIMAVYAETGSCEVSNPP